MLLRCLIILALLTVNAYANAVSFTVKDIRVEGLQRVTLGAVLIDIPVRVGDRATDEKIAQIISSLYDTENFEDIRVFREGQQLIIKLIELPTIASINFSGNDAIKDEQLQESLDAAGVKVGEAIDRTMVKELEKGLADFYYSVGKYNAKVRAMMTPLPRNRVDLQFIFTEGVSAAIQQINIIGNERFSDERLLSLFDLNVDVPWWNFLANDQYQKQVLQGDIERLRSFYLSQGYLKFDIQSSEVSITPEKKGVYISLQVHEGEQYRIRTVKFRGQLGEYHKDLTNLIQFESGDIYNGKLVTDLEESAKKLLGEFGYAYPEVTTIPSFDESTHQVDLTVQVGLGQRVYVRDIRFVGNYMTHDEVLRRELRQMERAWLDTSAVELSRSRLIRLGFFEKVDKKLIPVPGSDDLVDLVFEVKEAQAGNAEFSIGYGMETGINYKIGFQQSNFLGTGDRIGIHAATNQYQNNVSLDYRDPFWTLDNISLSGRIYYDDFDASKAGVVTFNHEKYGVHADLGFPIDELNRLEFGAGYSFNRLSNLQHYQQLDDFIQSQTGSTQSEKLSLNDIDVTLSWMLNDLDRGIFPTGGVEQSMYYKITTPFSDAHYYSIKYKVRNYIAFNQDRDFVLMMRGTVGYGAGYNGDMYPFYENFYAGGLSSGRGFAPRTIGPRAAYRETGNCIVVASGQNCYNQNDPIGGNAELAASVDFIFPMPFISESARQQLRTSVFIDAASVWDTYFTYDQDIKNVMGDNYYDYSDPTNFRTSYGLFVQWRSPLGLLDFSIALPWIKFAGDEEQFFSFSMGEVF